MAIDIHIGDNTNVAEIKYRYQENNFAKYIPVSQLSNIFKAYPVIETPFLPMGTRRYYAANDAVYLWIETPPHRRIIKAPSFGRTSLDVPFPVLVFLIKLHKTSDGYRYGTFQTYGQKHFTTSQNDIIYYSPLLNTNSSGGVCWGRVTPPAIQDLSGAYTYIDAFLNSNFNSDMSWDVNSGGTREEFYRHLVTLDTFPLDVLKPMHPAHHIWSEFIK